MSFLFLVGVGRSGTSLIQSMFASHPQVSCLPETAFIRRMVFSGYLQFIFKQHGEKAVSLALARDEYFARTKLDAEKVVTLAVAQGGLLDAAVYREMLALETYKDIVWAGDKDPRAVEFLPLLAAVLPDVHVIHVFRDPRDVLASKKKAAWSRNHSVLRHIFANRVQLNMGRSHGPMLFGSRYHEVVYEDVLEDPEGEMKRLCKGLGLPFDPAMLDFNQSAMQLVSESEMDWKKETLGPLLKDNHGKWRDQLAPWEVALTEVVCRGHFAAGRYAKSHTVMALPVFQRLGIFGLSGVMLAFEPLYRIYRSWTVWRARKHV